MNLPTLETCQPLLRGSHALSFYDLTIVDDVFKATSDGSLLYFNAEAYSRFKYGKSDVAERYAAILAKLLMPHLEPAKTANEQIIVLGTPYKVLPNAAKLLAISAERLLRSSGLPTSYTRIYQHRLAEGDYATLSSAERDQRNQQKRRFIDPADFEGKHAVVFDDVRVTGSIERSIMALLANIKVLSVTIVNLVRLDPTIAAEQPDLEDKLNRSAIYNLSDLSALMRESNNFTLTTRAVKFILESSQADVQWLLTRADLEDYQIAAIHDGIVDEGYDQMGRYRANYELVRSIRNR